MNMELMKMLTLGLKLAGASMVIAGSSGYGYGMAAQYGQRLKELEQLRQMIFLLKGQILYANAPLAEAFATVGRRTEGGLAQLFVRVAERIDEQEGEDFCGIWKDEIGKICGKQGEHGEQGEPGEQALPLALEKLDMQTLGELGEHLGFLDREMQERNLLLYLEQLDLVIGQLREHKQERCRLYTSLGVMGGLFLTILLV